MGCALSNDGEGRSANQNRRNTMIIKPTVSIMVGDGIKIQDKEGTKIIFIFGGPGSGKGTVVNNLVEMYNFRFICGEDLILEKLSEKLLVDHEVGTAATHKLQSLLGEDSSHLTLHWVLELLDEEISKYKGETVLIDIVPNLKFLLRIPTFSKCCAKEMALFEQKHAVTFAIDLSLDQDHLISNINQSHACSKSPSNGPTKDDKGNSDEMDTSRTQRRFNIYLNSVKEFLQYFEKDGKLLTVDTSCGNIESVWEAVSNYVVESDLAVPCKGIEQVILFKLNEDDYDHIDRERYPMLDIPMKDHVENYAEATPEKILKKLCIELRLHAYQWKSFLVDVSGSCLCKDEYLKKSGNGQLLFLECEQGQLDYFMHGLKRRTMRKKSLVRKKEQVYKAITTSENEALLFPEFVDIEICRKIGVCYLNSK